MGAIDRKWCLFTNDVETTSIWFNALRDDTGIKVMKEGMPILLDIYSQFNIQTTFYFTGYIAKLLPNIVKMVINGQHEVASHGKSHLPENAFDVMPYEKQKKHLEYSKKLLEDISGTEVISFRAPALRINDNTCRALIETGYRIDSSIAPQRFDFFLSFGSVNKLKWLFSPRLPYKTSKSSLFEKGDGPLVEVPLSALFFPYVGTTMRIFPFLTVIQRQLINLENSLNHKPIVFDIHPNEFIDESSEKRVVNRRSKKVIQYILSDLLRSRLKLKNLGVNAIPLYKREIEFYRKRDYQFATVHNYVKKNGFL